MKPWLTNPINNDYITFFICHHEPSLTTTKHHSTNLLRVKMVNGGLIMVVKFTIMVVEHEGSRAYHGLNHGQSWWTSLRWLSFTTVNQWFLTTMINMTNHDDRWLISLANTQQLLSHDSCAAPRTATIASPTSEPLTQLQGIQRPDEADGPLWSPSMGIRGSLGNPWMAWISSWSSMGPQPVLMIYG